MKRISQKAYFVSLIFILVLCSGYIFEKLSKRVTLPTSSMAPTILAGESVSYTRFFSHPLQRGTIVVYKSGEEKYVGRIIGIPGETFQLKESRVFINNSELIEEYSTPDTYKRGSNEAIVIPKETYVLMPDDRGLNPNDYKVILAKDIVGTIRK